VAHDLRKGSYRPLAARRVFIPKPGSSERRPLSIQTVRERVRDQGVLRLLRAMLRAGVMQDGSVRKPVTGTPQGGVVSPLLANVYLHRVDRAWSVREYGVLVRYADDLVVMCATRQQAEAALLGVSHLVVTAVIGLGRHCVGHVVLE
jgi:retron-type reverse transcriptase